MVDPLEPSPNSTQGLWGSGRRTQSLFPTLLILDSGTFGRVLVFPNFSHFRMIEVIALRSLLCSRILVAISRYVPYHTSLGIFVLISFFCFHFVSLGYGE